MAKVRAIAQQRLRQDEYGDFSTSFASRRMAGHLLISIA